MSELRQRRPRLILKKVTNAARDQHCTLHHPDYCNGRTDTTVACHFNWDKPVGGKRSDIDIAFGCSGCHEWLDRPTDDPDNEYWRLRLWALGHLETLRILIELGILKIA